MPITLPLPPEVESDFQAEARERGLDAEAYTRFAMDTLAEAFAENPPEDERQVLLLLSRLENELPRAWREADAQTRLKYALLLLAFWLLASPDRLRNLTAAVSSAVAERKDANPYVAGGFAAHLRRAREAGGDFRSGSQILGEERRREEEARNVALWGAERGAEINRRTELAG